MRSAALRPFAKGTGPWGREVGVWGEGEIGRAEGVGGEDAAWAWTYSGFLGNGALRMKRPIGAGDQGETRPHLVLSLCFPTRTLDGIVAAHP